MNSDDSNKKKTPAAAVPADRPPTIQHSGSGAETALLAMLKKRQMRASRDADPQLPATDAEKTTEE